MKQGWRGQNPLAIFLLKVLSQTNRDVHESLWWILAGLFFTNSSSWQVTQHKLWKLFMEVCAICDQRHYQTDLFHSIKALTELQSNNLGGTCRGISGGSPVTVAFTGSLLYTYWSYWPVQVQECIWFEVYLVRTLFPIILYQINGSG